MKLLQNRFLIAFASALLGAGTTVGLQCSNVINVTIADPAPVVSGEEAPQVILPEGVDADELGWAGPEEVAAAAPIVAGMPKFEIRGAAGDNTTANVRLWDASFRVLGKHIPNYPQETGDCVSFDGKNIVEYLMVNQLGIWRPVDTAYIYGTSRVDVGGGRLGCRSAGSVNAWMIQALQQHGVAFLDDPNNRPYSGSKAVDWGCHGPPESLREIARTRIVKTAAPVYTPDDVMNAICHRFPVATASGYGTKNFEKKYNRWIAKGDGGWSHSMAIVGYDGSQGERLWYMVNSWGEGAHKTPLQGEPPGGFWIRERDLKKILAARDSFAISSTEGFPAFDFSIIQDAGPRGPPKEGDES